MPRLRNANACWGAARKGFDWLKSNFGGDEEWSSVPHPLVTYHKLPYLFSIAGGGEECTRALMWIRSRLFTPQGDLLRAAPEKEGEVVERARVREKAWVALAAQKAGRFDLSFPVTDLLARQQGMNTGGVYDVDMDGRALPTANVRTTACAGMVFLLSGRMAAARAAGRFAVEVVQKQAPGPRFYVRLDNLGHLVQRFPSSKVERYVVAQKKSRTMLSYLGIPIVFLARLYRATAEEEWLEAAMDYYAAAETFGDAALTGLDSGTFAWGAASLYNITRRRFYYDMAERITQSWVATQKQEGFWRPRGAELPEAISTTIEASVSLMETVREAQ